MIKFVMRVLIAIMVRNKEWLEIETEEGDLICGSFSKKSLEKFIKALGLK